MTSSAMAYSSSSAFTAIGALESEPAYCRSSLSASRVALAPNNAVIFLSHAPWNPAPTVGRRLAQSSLGAGMSPSPMMGFMMSVRMPLLKESARSLNIVRTATGSDTTTNHLGPAPRLYTPPYSR